MIDVLWSINERLSGRPGLDVGRPSRDWLGSIERALAYEQAMSDPLSMYGNA